MPQVASSRCAAPSLALSEWALLAPFAPSLSAYPQVRSIPRPAPRRLLSDSSRLSPQLARTASFANPPNISPRESPPLRTPQELLAPLLRSRQVRSDQTPVSGSPA